jgi:septal ring factor EnvC (AmiA/AmiB activator)
MGFLTKSRLYIIAGAALTALGLALYVYYIDTQNRLQMFASNQKVLEISVDQQRETITELTEDIQRLLATIADLNQSFSESREAVRKLENKFNQSANGDERDFGELAAEKPALIEKVVNSGTQDVFRCFELLSGDTADLEELDNEELIDCINNVVTADSM